MTTLCTTLYTTTLPQPLLGPSGSLCEYMTHECLKNSLAFSKLAMAVVSRHPARAEGL